jgi:hypothetical protein
MDLNGYYVVYFPVHVTLCLLLRKGILAQISSSILLVDLCYLVHMSCHISGS